MQIACDEAGFTGPDLLAPAQRYFAFASVSTNDDDAWSLIRDARTAHPVQMPELKASKLLKSVNGRGLIGKLILDLDGRFAVNAHDKLLALCGWMFEYIFEPVYQDDPRVLYENDFHRFIAMFSYLWFLDKRSEAPEAIRQFQAFMRNKDVSLAPLLFEYKGDRTDENAHPFDLIRRFATAHRNLIAADVRRMRKDVPDGGVWTLDLSASALWSHLKHWSSSSDRLNVLCDDSKPLRASVAMFTNDANEGILEYIAATQGKRFDSWTLEKPIEFADSRGHPSIQLADLIAGTVVNAYASGLHDDLKPIAALLDSGMLQDSIFPDFDRVRLEHASVQVDYLVLFELTKTAEGEGTGLPLRAYWDFAKRSIAEGTGPRFEFLRE